ncbi:MAG: hypothetical protein WA183_15940 [Chthoniobacterales bacterium]
MAYDPHEQFRGDQFFYSAITGAGQDIAKAAAKAADERERIAKTGAYNDTVMQIAHQNGRVSDDEWNKYQASSLSQKSGIATGHAADMAAEIDRQLKQSQMAKDQAETAAAQQHAALLKAQTEGTGPFADPTLYLTDEDRANAYTTHKLPLRTSKQSFQWVNDPNYHENNKGTPIDKFGRPVDPNNPKSKAVGLQQPDGTIKFYPQSTTVQELLDNTPTATPTPVKVTTQADLDSLPSGTVFIAPDGSRRRKP